MPVVKPRVRLLSNTPNPELSVAESAKLCYASDEETNTKFSSIDEARKFIKRYIVKPDHGAMLEHAIFKFRITGVSRACINQLVRHRHASYAQRSQRYVNEENFNYILPAELENKSATPSLGKHCVIWLDELTGDEIDDKEMIWEEVNKALNKNILATDYYEETMRILSKRYRVLNSCLSSSSKESNEVARYILPNACETKIDVTLNAREIRHICSLRLCNRAQREVREVFNQVLVLVRVIAPSLFENVGPRCIQLGRCPEGKKGCGQLSKMRDKYLELSYPEKKEE